MAAPSRIVLDKDWIALNVYRMALEQIIERTLTDSGFTADKAAGIAERAMEGFPGSFGK